jgi:hypothetical protein
MLVKYTLQSFAGDLYFYSSAPITKELTLQVPTQCSGPMLTLNRELQPSKECIYEFKVSLEILANAPPVSREKLSVSVGVAVLMLGVLIILVWICLVKYRGMEGHAKVLLARYRQKKGVNDKRFTI